MAEIDDTAADHPADPVIVPDTDQAAVARSTPRHLWVVGIVSLLWNSFGALDYTMTQTRNAAYLAKVPAEVMAYVTSVPAWFTAFWALGVWGAVVGSLMLLLRNRLAVPVFGISLLGLAVTQLYSRVIDPAPAAMGGGGAMGAVEVVIWAIAIGLLVYATAMARRGVLR